MSDGDMFLKILGFVILGANVATAWAVLSGRAQTRSIEPQPLEVRAAHDCVPKPEFEEVTNKLWQNVNGIRRELSEHRAEVHAVKAVREENTQRLRTIEHKVDTASAQVSALGGAMEQVVERISAAARTAEQAALTAQAAMVEAQHKRSSA